MYTIYPYSRLKNHMVIELEHSKPQIFFIMIEFPDEG